MIPRYRIDENGTLVPDEAGDVVLYRDYLADEDNWVPFEDYKQLDEQFKELLASLRKK